MEQALIDYGYWGMFLSAILAGSVVPFSSEVVMLGLLAAGVSDDLRLNPNTSASAR